jgi:hypothetical protein
MLDIYQVQGEKKVLSMANMSKQKTWLPNLPENESSWAKYRQWRSQEISIGVARMGPVIIFGWQACVSQGDAELFKTHTANISTLFGIQMKVQ